MGSLLEAVGNLRRLTLQFYYGKDEYEENSKFWLQVFAHKSRIPTAVAALGSLRFLAVRVGDSNANREENFASFIRALTNISEWPYSQKDGECNKREEEDRWGINEWTWYRQ